MAELNRTPNPAGSPNEKLITQNPLERIEDYIRGKLGEGPVTNEELIEVFRFYDERMQYEVARQNRNLELWANVHTHPGGTNDGKDVIRDLTSLTFLGSDSTGLTQYYLPIIDLSTNRLAIGGEAQSRVDIFDVTDATLISLLGSVGSMAYPEQLDMWEGGGNTFLLVANAGLDSMALVEATDPSNPTVLSRTSDTQFSGACFINSSYIAAYRQNADELVIYEWTNTSSLSRRGAVAFADTNATVRKLDDTHVIVSGAIFDVSDPMNPTIVSSGWTTGGSSQLAIIDTNTVGVNGALWDVTDRANPVLLSSLIGGNLIEVNPSYVLSVQSDVIRLWKVSDPSAPVQIDEDVSSMSGTVLEWAHSDGLRAWIMTNDGTLWSWSLDE